MPYQPVYKAAINEIKLACSGDCTMFTTPVVLIVHLSSWKSSWGRRGRRLVPFLQSGRECGWINAHARR